MSQPPSTRPRRPPRGDGPRRTRARAATATTEAGKPSPTSTPEGTRAARRDPAATREALLAAARAEFDERGFEGTDTNRISRRAGYAPQTFYRHFADKTAIFVEAYHRWLSDEWKDLEKASGLGAAEAARILLEHHARHRQFRRSLRRLTTSDPAVRAARAESRRRQLALLDERNRARHDASGKVGSRATGDAQANRAALLSRVALLFCIERIADAAADGELSDLGLSAEDQADLLAGLLRRFGEED